MPRWISATRSLKSSVTSPKGNSAYRDAATFTGTTPQGFGPIKSTRSNSDHQASLATWRPERAYDLITCVHGLHYIGDKLGLVARAASWLADRWLDDRIGFYPLSLRQSLRHGFNRERMHPGHQNWFLDPNRAGSLPRWQALDRLMTRWHYGRARYIPRTLLERLLLPDQQSRPQEERSAGDLIQPRWLEFQQSAGSAQRRADGAGRL